MRPFVFSILATLLLIFTVTIITAGSMALNARPDSAIGVFAIITTAMSPVFLVLYVAGFATTYWFTRSR
jgi:hypothetical protein